MSEMSTWGSRSGKERSFSCSTVTWMVMVSLGCVMRMYVSYMSENGDLKLDGITGMCEKWGSMSRMD